MIVLDTSVVIDLFRGSETARSYLTSDSATTVITRYEILAGMKHRNAKSEGVFLDDSFRMSYSLR